MSTSKKIFINCDDSNHYCDKNQYKEASFWERIRLGLHLIYCRNCKEYSMRNNKLSKLMKTSNVKTISQKDKQDIETLIHQELLKKQG